MDKEKTVCFSGYRPEKFSYSLSEKEPAYLELRERTRQAIIQARNEGYANFLCGMAQGFDLIAGNEILELMAKRPDMSGVKLIAVFPFEGHGRGFPSPWREIRQMFLTKAAEVITLGSVYHAKHYLARDRYMVDHSSRLICYYDGKKGGTEYTVKYAIERALNIINIVEPIPFKPRD
ncbi:MAG: DUF1273 domain-containing protein [Deltaproteobacteria bacterium]|jgi:uncharacterized phage-like protein YoqJ|nr:DUF1273 domain-containing protein [Deltaproteobacteria bacterium]